MERNHIRHKMNWQKTYLIFAALTAGVSAVPRGAGQDGGGIRGREERKLQMDAGMDAGGAAPGGGGPGGDDGGDGGDTTFTGLTEWHSCEANPAKAIEYVDYMGHKDKGSLECYADPINGCSGGCCRFGAYFICDTDNFAPHLACVCNENTQPAPGGGSSVSTPLPAPVGTVTTAPVTAATFAPVAGFPTVAAAPVAAPVAAAGTDGGTFAPIAGFPAPFAPVIGMPPASAGLPAIPGTSMMPVAGFPTVTGPPFAEIPGGVTLSPVAMGTAPPV
jgi:hypothetical protein